MNRGIIVLAGLALLLTGCAADASAGPDLEAVVDECRIGSSDFARVGDEGRSLTLDQRGNEDANGLGYDDIECVLDAIDMPDSAFERMLQTSSNDGFQDAEWDQTRATWSYHPDDGLNVIIELTD